MVRVLASICLNFIAIGGCSLGLVLVFLLGPPFWRDAVGPTYSVPAAISTYGAIVWVAARLMYLADWLLETRD